MMLTKKQQYNKTYYEKHKEKVKQYNYEKINCIVCNRNISRCVLRRHQKTKKHKTNLNQFLGVFKNTKFGGKYQESPL